MFTNQRDTQKNGPSHSWLWLGIAGAFLLAAIVCFVIGIVRCSSDPVVANDTPESVIREINDNMVYVEGGTFQMGCHDAFVDEIPVHPVTLSSFFISRYEVTQRQWQTLMGSNPSAFVNPDSPVEQVSWNDCQKFINKLNEVSGLQYRLPTEAEWEFAARGGNNHDAFLYAGSQSLDSVGWYDANSGEQTHPVGLKQPNSLGLYDMSGNVWEWCQDWYDSEFYSRSPSASPRNDTPSETHVLRGGSSFYIASSCRVFRRGYYSPDGRESRHGFRLAR